MYKLLIKGHAIAIRYYHQIHFSVLLAFYVFPHLSCTLYYILDNVSKSTTNDFNWLIFRPHSKVEQC